MYKMGLVITSRLEGAGKSAIYRALMFAQELERAGDDVVLVFDGAGSTSAAELLAQEHPMHAMLQGLLPRVRGVCRHCARSYGVLDAVTAGGAPLLGEDRGHASLRALLVEGRQLVTF